MGRSPYRPDNRIGKPQPDREMRLPNGGTVRVVSIVTDPNTADYTADEWEFLKAMEQYKRENRRPFPTGREMLAVLLALGYRKPEPSE